MIYSIGEENLIKQMVDEIKKGKLEGIEHLDTWMLRELVFRIHSRKLNKKGKKLSRSECIILLKAGWLYRIFAFGG